MIIVAYMPQEICKICSHCKTTYNVEYFYNSKYTKDGKNSWCKNCVKNSKTPEQKRKLSDWQRTPEGKLSRFKARIKFKYGLEFDKYQEMLKKQHNACGVCGTFFKSSKDINIDHCHKTNLFRGIICSSCNKALGFVQDRADILNNLILYVRKHLAENGLAIRKVILESPFAGNVEENIKYARRAMRDSLLRGEAPFASHLLYTQDFVLDDNIPEQRNLGIEAGLSWGNCADASVVYVDYGMSKGMQLGIERAKAEGRPIEIREIGKNDVK